jgi:hypothetical protein
MSVADDILARATLPTHLSSQEIRDEWSRRIREQAVFSARTTNDSYLQSLRTTLAKIADGSINGARAREILLGRLDELGYDAEAGGFPGDEGIPLAKVGTLRDLASGRRLRLILETNETVGDSLANLARASDPEVVSLQPGWRLIPGRYRKAPRSDWAERWRLAGESVAWEGAVRDQSAALKDSPIWAALGEGAGGFRDTLGNPYPPFAWGSGLTWIDIPRDECIALGLVKETAA